VNFASISLDKNEIQEENEELKIIIANMKEDMEMVLRRVQ
jgi:hypothetical protein